MTLTRVVGKGRTEPIERADLDARRRDAVHTVVDVGTGDGRYPYALAADHDDWFVIGIDALDEAMGETAYKAGRKPAKGGRANVVYLRGAVEQMPEELRDIADEVHVMLPWGRLLEGIVVPDADVLRGLALLGPRLHVVLNGEIWESSLPVRFDHLPVPTPEHIAANVAPALAAAGIAIEPARYMTAAEAKGLPTTWARRLGHNRDHPRFVTFDGTRAAH